MPLEDIAKVTRVCDICGCEEESEDAEKPCETKNVKHRFLRHHYWLAIVAVPAFGIRSERTALQFFSESVWDREAYQVARALTDEEVSLVREGKARLAITVERI